MTAFVLGIDPGITGGWAVIRYEDGALIGAGDIPNVDGRVDVAMLTLVVRCLLDGDELDDIELVAIEDIRSRPGQGAPSMWTFARACGALEAWIPLTLPRARIKRVTPAVWKRSMGLTADKATSLGKAGDLWPGRFGRKGRHNQAEAALLAEYARHQNMRSY